MRARSRLTKGEAISTLTDVYSLGVVLYELLTGHRHYKVRSAAAQEIVRVISEEEPTLPSDVVTTTDNRVDRQAITPEAVSRVREGDLNKLRKSLRADLDSIVLTTLRKEPARRYSSVEALGEDLRRHLEHRPVAAKPDDPWYRASRFIRRNAAGVVAVALVVISVIFGMAAVIWQVYITLDTRQDAFSSAPFWVISVGHVFAACCAAAYFLRPSRARVAGALAGGAVWAMGVIGQFWLAFSLGWFRSHFPTDPDPLRIVSVPTFIVGVLLGTVVMPIAMAIGRRFGRRGQLLFVVLLAFGQPAREGVWFSRILPLITVSWEPVPPKWRSFVSGASLCKGDFRFPSPASTKADPTPPHQSIEQIIKANCGCEEWKPLLRSEYSGLRYHGLNHNGHPRLDPLKRKIVRLPAARVN